MGADLYIKDLDREEQYTGFEVSERAVDLGYFRDCYNSYGLFAGISATLKKDDISWWLTADREELFREDEEEGLVMTVEGVKQFYDEMKKLVDKYLKRKTLYIQDYVYDRKGGYSTEYRKCNKKDTENFKEHARLFLRFLELAIKKNSEIVWSV